MKCNACGNMGFTATSCPDCGSEDISQEAGSATLATDTAAANEAPPPVMPDMPGMSVPTDVAGPVVGTIVLPDSRRVEMRDGDEFSIAHTDTDQDVTFKSDDESVSRTPVRIHVKDGKMFVTGGGSSGISLIVTERHKPDEVVELRRGVSIAIGVGKNTRLPIKQ